MTFLFSAINVTNVLDGKSIVFSSHLEWINPMVCNLHLSTKFS